MIQSTQPFNTIKIGQEWMTENLNVDTFRNGDPIPEVRTKEEWIKAGDNKQPAWCYYNNDSANGSTYGKLYNWYALNDPRGLAPEGWHVPSEDEWDVLINYLGGEEVAGGKMKAMQLWVNPNSDATNEIGFSGLPGGYRDDYGTFNAIGKTCEWWSSTQFSTNNAWIRFLYNKNGNVYRNVNSKKGGRSVRCLRD